MSDIWVISDTHFNHEAILTFKDYAGKPPRNGFIDVDHMNETMLDNWASVVTVSYTHLTLATICSV